MKNRVTKGEQIKINKNHTIHAMQYNGFDEESVEVFLDEVREGEIDVIKEFVSQDKDILTVRNKYGNSAIHYASANGHLELLKYLLSFPECREIINLKNESGSTALHWSIPSDVHIAKLLLEAGADKEITNAQGKTALTMAEDAAKDELVNILIGEDIMNEIDATQMFEDESEEKDNENEKEEKEKKEDDSEEPKEKRENVDNAPSQEGQTEEVEEGEIPIGKIVQVA